MTQTADLCSFDDKKCPGASDLWATNDSGRWGGQRQRPAIARALLKRPRVLIFDVAFASPDYAAAEQVAKAVNDILGEVTVLFITQKVPAALKVNQHLKLGGG